MTLYALGEKTPVLPEDGDYWIAPGANVIGSVVVGSACSVWFGATLRGDNETITLGRGTNVQENTVMHTDAGYPLTIGTNCTIGHKAMLHGCTIEDGVLIGMGATILNGAVIGANSLIGAHALITEGKEIPPGSLVMGAPGKVVKQLAPEMVGTLIASAEHYQARMRQFREELRPVG